MYRWHDSEQTQRSEHASSKRSKSRLREFLPQRDDAACRAQYNHQTDVEDSGLTMTIESVVKRRDKRARDQQCNAEIIQPKIKPYCSLIASVNLKNLKNKTPTSPAKGKFKFQTFLLSLKR